MTDLPHGANGSIINTWKLPETGLAGLPTSTCMWGAMGDMAMNTAGLPGHTEQQLRPPTLGTQSLCAWRVRGLHGGGRGSWGRVDGGGAVVVVGVGHLALMSPAAAGAGGQQPLGGPSADSSSALVSAYF